MWFRCGSGISWTMSKQSAPRSTITNQTNTSSLSLYRPDALPGAHLTVSKHCFRQVSAKIKQRAYSGKSDEIYRQKGEPLTKYDFYDLS